MVLPNLLHQAHEYVRLVLRKGGVAIDATVGNGNDTLFLAKSVGKSGVVFGFDIQEQALQVTRRRLQKEGQSEQVQLFCYPHQEPWSEVIPNQFIGTVETVMFNLGYLPHGDPSIITKPLNTIKACEQALEWLKPRGLVTLMLYTGHKGGEEEAEEVMRWCRCLSGDRYQVMALDCLNRNHSPKLVVIGKKC